MIVALLPIRGLRPPPARWGTVDQSPFVSRPTTGMIRQVCDRITAFQRGGIVADMLLREMLVRIPATSGEPS